MPRKVRTEVWLFLYAAIALALIPGYFLQVPIPEFQMKVFSFGEAILLWLACVAAGRLILNSARKYGFFRGEDRLSKFFLPIIYAGIGIGAIGTIVLVLGSIHPASLNAKLAGLSFVLLIMVLRDMRMTVRALAALKNYAEQTFGWIEVACLSVAAAGAGIALVTCFSPITYYDSLVYHLALPELYNHLGRISPQSANLYSYFPANTEMIYLLIMNRITNPDYVINVFGWLISLNISALLFLWAKRTGGLRAGTLAVALWWSAPAVMLLSIGGYIDVPLAFQVTLAIFAFVLARENDWDLGWLALSGLFCGIACSTKYTGAICPLILGSVLVGSKGGIKRVGVFIFAMLPTFGFWLAKNALSIGNPVFPFFYQWLGGAPGWTKETAAGYFQMLTQYGSRSRMFFDVFLAPVTITSSALGFGGGFDVLGDFGWSLLLAATGGSYFLARERSNRFLSAYFLAHFFLWFVSKPVLRFLVPVMPLACLLSAHTIRALLLKRPGVKIATGILILPWVISNFFVYGSLSNELRLFAVPFGQESAHDYLERRLPIVKAYDSINAQLNQTDKVFIVGEQRTYHLNIPFIASNFFAPSLASHFSNLSPDASSLFHSLDNLGITHILINESELARCGGMQAFGFDNTGEANFFNFLRQKTKPLWREGSIILFKLKD